jgi:hypothetical protein
MTPRKLLICLEFYARAGAGADSGYREWLDKPRGKVDLPWKLYMELFNLELSKFGEGEIGLVPASPNSYRGGFVLGWPVGFPHGSFANSKVEDRMTGKGSRITLTVPVTLKGSSQKADPRIPARLEAMGTLSTGGLSPDAYVEAEKWLENDKTPYADGLTHKNPFKIRKLIRHPDAVSALEAAGDLDKEIGPFYPISIKLDTAKRYNALLRGAAGAAGSSGIAPMVPAVPAVPAVPMVPMVPVVPVVVRHPILAEMLTKDTRLLKVKQPWADALVSGQKNVENRSWFLKPSTGFPTWLVIVASEAKPSAALMADYNRRMDELYPFGRLTSGTARDEYALGAAVGVIELLGCYAADDADMSDEARNSVWYNAGDVAWHIGRAFEFVEPFQLNAEDKFQTQAILDTSRYKDEYVSKLQTEFEKLELAT